MGFLGWLKGYLILRVTGKFPERFINLCTLNGVYIKDALRKEDSFIIKTSKKAFRKMIKPAKRTHCRVKIIKKVGLPFKLKKIGKRKALIIGGVFFILLISVLNSFIWTVRVDGNEILTEEEIKIIADYCGLRQGVVKYKMDEKKFSENALKCEPRLSWIWPEIKGTVCYIHVREKAIVDPPLDVKKPSDVIAKRSGRINSMTVKRGWAKVFPGDSVVAGQILISSEKEGFTPVHAMGEVLASYWSEVSQVAYAEKEIITYTGEEKSYYSLVIGNFGMSFRFSGKAPYENYEEEKEEFSLKLFNEINLPIKIKKTEYKEILKDSISRSLDKAVNETEETIINEFRKSLPMGEEIIDITVKTEEISETEALVKVIFECSGDIGIND